MTEDQNKNEEKQNEEDVVYEQESEEISANLEKLRKKLKECREEKEKYLTGWQRAQADFINYRRRQEEQMADWSKTLGEGLIRDILPALDSLDAALKVQPQDEGLKTFASQIKSILKKHGLEEMTAIGEKFNPECHEAIECVNEEKEIAGENIVAQEIQKGYKLNGKIIRVAKVKVTKL